MRKVAWSVVSFLLGVLAATSIRSAFAAEDCCTLLQRRVEVLEKRIAVFESAITISGGSVTIRGATITVKADGELKLMGAKISQN